MTVSPEGQHDFRGYATHPMAGPAPWPAHGSPTTCMSMLIGPTEIFERRAGPAEANHNPPTPGVAEPGAKVSLGRRGWSEVGGFPRPPSIWPVPNLSPLRENFLAMP